MKKILFLFLFIFCAHAETIYCPPQIICEYAHDVNSCTYDQRGKAYWDTIKSNANLPGIYVHTYVSAPYYSYDQGYALCVYTHESGYNTLTLPAKPESNIEASLEEYSGWCVEETWWECAPKKSDCPLQEQAALMIENKCDTVLLLSNGFEIPPGHFSRLYHQDIAMGFVDLYMTSNYLGRICVDIFDQLKIIDIIQSSDELAEIEQMDEFNAVSIKTNE